MSADIIWSGVVRINNDDTYTSLAEYDLALNRAYFDEHGKEKSITKVLQILYGQQFNNGEPTEYAKEVIAKFERFGYADASTFLIAYSNSERTTPVLEQDGINAIENYVRYIISGVKSKLSNGNSMIVTLTFGKVAIFERYFENVLYLGMYHNIITSVNESTSPGEIASDVVGVISKANSVAGYYLHRIFS